MKLRTISFWAKSSYQIDVDNKPTMESPVPLQNHIILSLLRTLGPLVEFRL